MWQPCKVEVLVTAQEEFSIDIQARQLAWGIPTNIPEMVNLIIIYDHNFDLFKVE